MGSKLSSYRSIRFNLYFEGAARLIQNLASPGVFVRLLPYHDNLLIDSVRKDCHDRNLMALITTLGFIYVHFTGPYWQLVRSSAKFQGLPSYVKSLHLRFNTWIHTLRANVFYEEAE